MHLIKLISFLSHLGVLVAIQPPQGNPGLPGGDGKMEVIRDMSRKGSWEPVGMDNLPFEALKRKDLYGEEKRRLVCEECMAKVLGVVSRSFLGSITVRTDLLGT